MSYISSCSCLRCLNSSLALRLESRSGHHLQSCLPQKVHHLYLILLVLAWLWMHVLWAYQLVQDSTYGDPDSSISKHTFKEPIQHIEGNYRQARIWSTVGAMPAILHNWGFRQMWSLVVGTTLGFDHLCFVCFSLGLLANYSLHANPLWFGFGYVVAMLTLHGLYWDLGCV